LYGNAGEDIYGVQNVDMNPFQQADNFDDIGSGSNSLLDVQDSCMNENEIENLINRHPYTSIKNENRLQVTFLNLFVSILKKKSI
jgi:hypothetical protein